jgi:hypothetical protein
MRRTWSILNCYLTDIPHYELRQNQIHCVSKIVDTLQNGHEALGMRLITSPCYGLAD